MTTTFFLHMPFTFLLHKDLKRQELNWNTIKKFTIIIVTEEVFFLARSIHNWQLFAAPRIWASRIICGWCAHTLNLCSYHKFVKKNDDENTLKSYTNISKLIKLYSNDIQDNLLGHFYVFRNMPFELIIKQQKIKLI